MVGRCVSTIVVVVLLVVDVVVAEASGAHTSFAALGLTVRLANSSAPFSDGRTTFGHLTL